MERRERESKRKQIRIQTVIRATEALGREMGQRVMGVEVRSELSQVGPGKAVREGDFW